VAGASARHREDDRVPSTPDRQPPALDRAGLALAVAGAGWAAATGAASGGRPLPLALVFVGVVAAVLGAPRLPLPARRALLAAVAAGPWLLLVARG
jgi:hypothetical protein